MDPVEAVARFLIDHEVEPSHLLLALSGGFDSTALVLTLAPLRDAGYHLTAAHVNHHLRGADSSADERFVKRLCGNLDIPLRIVDGRLSREAIREYGIEGAARNLRYDALERVRAELHADYIVTAHQKNDLAETVLMRLISSGAVSGLRGIAPRSERILRPMLEVSRSEVESLLASAGVAPRIDRSNFDARFTRNRIRHELMPLLETINPNVVSALVETAKQIREITDIASIYFDEIASRAVRRSAHRSDIDLDAIPPRASILETLLLREIRHLQPRSRDVSTADLRRFAAAAGKLSRVSVTKRLELVRRGNTLSLCRRRPPTAPFEHRIEPGVECLIDEISARVVVRRLPNHPEDFRSSDGLTQCFQLPEPAGAFSVRNRRSGDRFRPLGMASEKSLNHFLIDRKIRRDERENILLLLWNDQIVWVSSVEVSEHFRVSDSERPVWEVAVDYRND
jgi:tRNA(Ile)-lysidine synthetase, N-terminal domain/tRNA(Ile)-lysidine synthetase, C-terminal domain